MILTPDILAALALYALATSVTPGPNNMMLLASGVNFGFQRTIPHMLGIAGGFALMAIPVGLGLGALFLAMPALHVVLKVIAGAYMLWLAWRIANISTMAEGRAGASPMSFWQAAFFQFVNPKAVFMAITAMSAYTNPEHPFVSVFAVAVVFSLINLPSVGVWAVFGASLRQWLSDPLRLKWFNLAMAALLVLSLWPILRM